MIIIPLIVPKTRTAPKGNSGTTKVPIISISSVNAGTKKVKLTS